MKATILLAEDERDMREVLCDYFTVKSGGELTMISAPDGNTALHLIETQPFDLLLLDIMLPGTDGFALCRAAREQGEAPILFITAREDEQDKLHGYGLGADDYVVKPFSLAVLYAKVQALLRRTYDFAPAEPVLSHRGAVLQTGGQSLLVNGEKLPLSKNEYRILWTLLKEKGKIVSRERLMEALWQTDSFVDENTLSVNMARLRKKLDGAGLAGFIATRVGAGYLVE